MFMPSRIMAGETNFCRITENVLTASVPFVMLCVIWCHLYYLKIVKNVTGGVLLLVKPKA